MVVLLLLVVLDSTYSAGLVDAGKEAGP